MVEAKQVVAKIVAKSTDRDIGCFTEQNSVNQFCSQCGLVEDTDHIEYKVHACREVQ